MATNQQGNESKIDSKGSSFKQATIFEHFFYNSRDLVCIAGLDGYFKIINPSFTSVLGYSEEELTNRPFTDFVHPEDVGKTNDEVARMRIEQRSTLLFENRYITKEGHIIYFQWNTTINFEEEIIYGVARDITEQKRMEQKLEQSEKLLNAAQSIAKLGSWSFNVRNYDLFWSDELYNIFEIKPLSENLYEQYLSRFDEDGLSKLNEAIALAINAQKSYQFEHTVNLQNGIVKYVRCSGIPILDENGETLKIDGVVQDITETKNSSKELEKSEHLLNETQSIAKTGSWSMDFESGELYWSRETYKIYEIDPSIKGIELSKSFYSLFTDEERHNLNKLVNEALDIGKPYTSERLVQFPSGTKKWIRGSGMPIADINGKITKIEGIAQDVTDSKIAQLTILNNIREKEILLKEIHHRVKNNLQVISSMLNLQSTILENEEIKVILQESQQRIKSMATIHDLLYRSANLSEINFSEYIQNLLRDLVYSYKGISHNMELKIQIPDNIMFHLDKAIPLGLFVNEIITNSIKHGLKEVNNAEITLNLESSENGHKLELGDNGIGFDIEKVEKDTLGLILIDSLASQLDGQLQRTSDKNGTKYELTF
jgi:PAS domain S-box-containing protein